MELHFVTFIRISFGHCHVTFPYKEILSFFGHCHVTFPYMEPLSFFGMCVKKSEYLAFQIHLFRKRRNNELAAVMLQVIPSFYTKLFKKTSPYFCKHI